jgi:molybdopterin synthase sulfur carrier subunit
VVSPVTITVRYFALVREVSGRSSERVEWNGEGVTVKEFMSFLGERNGPLREFIEGRRVLCAVNREYAAGEESLKDGDEVALFPAVSGG